jgi:KEOPS complex subunit Pcc1
MGERDPGRAFDHEAVFSATYDADCAERVERSIRPEVGEIDGDRTAVAVSRDGATLEVTVSAADPVALRAGLNTWLHLIEVAERAGGCVDAGAVEY